MVHITKKLYIGTCEDCPLAFKGKYRVLLACHYPCERVRHKTPGCLPLRESLSTHGESSREVMIHDLSNREIPNYCTQDFIHSLDVLSHWARQDHNMVVISEHARSRAASLVLLWMAFRDHTLSRSSYVAARSDFSRIYPQYTPWPGMVIFLNQEWDAFH